MFWIGFISGVVFTGIMSFVVIRWFKWVTDEG